MESLLTPGLGGLRPQTNAVDKNIKPHLLKGVIS